MSGSSVLTYLRELCRQMDEGRPSAKLRKAAVILSIPAASLAQGCRGDPGSVALYGIAEYAAPLGRRLDGLVRRAPSTQPAR